PTPGGSSRRQGGRSDAVGASRRWAQFRRTQGRQRSHRSANGANVPRLPPASGFLEYRAALARRYLRRRGQGDTHVDFFCELQRRAGMSRTLCFIPGKSDAHPDIIGVFEDDPLLLALARTWCPYGPEDRRREAQPERRDCDGSLAHFEGWDL